jgi:hypothetical protein
VVKKQIKYGTGVHTHLPKSFNSHNLAKKDGDAFTLSVKVTVECVGRSQEIESEKTLFLRGHAPVELILSSDPQCERGHDHDLKWVAKCCDCQPENQRGMAKCRS